MLTQPNILRALRDCYDPDIPLNLVDLGCIDHIAITLDTQAPGANIPGVPPRHRVAIHLTPATQDETKQAQLSAQIQNRLAGIETIYKTEVHLSPDPWSPTRITPEGRRILKLDNPFSILNNALSRHHAN